MVTDWVPFPSPLVKCPLGCCAMCNGLGKLTNEPMGHLNKYITHRTTANGHLTSGDGTTLPVDHTHFSTLFSLRMKISAKDEYACSAVLELALNYESDAPVRVQYIAQRQGIPIKFLFQIMQILKRVDIV